VGAYNAPKVRLFSLYLTDIALSWFSSLAPRSIISWDMLERRFHDHFCSGSLQLKLTDLTLVKQERDEVVSVYIKRFKETKNCFINLSITDMDLANICLKGLLSSIRDKIEASDFCSAAQVCETWVPLGPHRLSSRPSLTSGSGPSEDSPT
jgi:hypothetical protein